MSPPSETRILVIDDEADVREMVRVLLTRAGYTVDTSGNLSEIVASLLVGRYDLLTVDLKMPEIDGQDIAELAKAVNQQIPIIVISGFLTPDLKKQLEDMGVRHFVNKPFKPDQLLQTVVDGLSGSPHTV